MPSSHLCGDGFFFGYAGRGLLPRPGPPARKGGVLVLPMEALRLQLGVLLAADATTLAPASLENKIALIIAPFVLAETLVYSDLVLAAANGLAPLAGIAGAQGVAQDPVSQSQIITILPPPTGWRWVSSGSGFPITVYGAALIDNGATTLLAVEQFSVPIQLTAAGYQVEIDPVQMTFVLQPLS